MRVAVCSDIHLEFGRILLRNEDQSDVLILSGDIFVAGDIELNMNIENPIREFFDNVSNEYKHVICIMGNHEHYHGDFAKTKEVVQGMLKYPNVYLLDKETVTINDTIFYGATFWTDMNKEDPQTLYAIKGMMNDYKTIKNSSKEVSFKDKEGKRHLKPGRLIPEDTVNDHKEAIKELLKVLEENKGKKIVVVGHHAPTTKSIHPKYSKDYIVNGAYASDLSNIMLDNENIVLWTHGHTHHPYDYTIGKTRVVCNPRGYIFYEDIADDFTLKSIDI